MRTFSSGPGAEPAPYKSTETAPVIGVEHHNNNRKPRPSKRWLGLIEKIVTNAAVQLVIEAVKALAGSSWPWQASAIAVR